MTSLQTVFSHSPRIVTRKTGNEYVLVPVANNIADMDSVYTLNESGAFIWELIDGKRNVEEIISAVTHEFDTNGETAGADVLNFLENLKDYLIISK